MPSFPVPSHRADVSATRSRWARRAAAVVVTLALVGLVSVASAAPTTDTTAVDVVPLTPVKTVLSGALVNASATRSVAVIDGTTTVPSNATTVRLEVTVTGTANGTLQLFPAGNPSGGAGHTVSWNANQVVTATTKENVGFRNMVSVKNLSTKTAKVTMRITGYSTQVTAGDVNGSGGTAGQALVNNGAGGARWGEPGRAFANYRPQFQGLSVQGSYISEVSVPPGSYVARFSATVNGGAPTGDFARCWLYSPALVAISSASASVGAGFVRNVVAMQGLVTTATGGLLRVFCRSEAGNAMSLSDASVIAQSVGTVSGSVTG